MIVFYSFIHLPIRFFNVDTNLRAYPAYLSWFQGGSSLSIKKTAAPRSSSSSSGSAAPRLPGSPFLLGSQISSTAARLLMLSSLAAPRSSGHFIVSAATRSSGHFVSTAPRSSGHFLVSTTPRFWNQFLVMSEKGTTERPQYNTQHAISTSRGGSPANYRNFRKRKTVGVTGCKLSGSSVEAQTRYLEGVGMVTTDVEPLQEVLDSDAAEILNCALSHKRVTKSPFKLPDPYFTKEQWEIVLDGQGELKSC